MRQSTAVHSRRSGVPQARKTTLSELEACMLSHRDIADLVSLLLSSRWQPKPRDKVVETLLKYIHTDTTCCRVENGKLATRQAQVKSVCRVVPFLHIPGLHPSFTPHTWYECGWCPMSLGQVPAQAVHPDTSPSDCLESSAGEVSKLQHSKLCKRY